MIAVVSHDAGGAEILSSYVLRENLECAFVLEGPACSIFARKLGAVRTASLFEAVQGAQWVLTGTSWQSDLELEAIKLAKERGLRSVAFLDHWVNYRERLSRGDQSCLPDEVWVGDTVGLDLARELFPGLSVRLVENPYFQEIRRGLAAAPSPSSPAAAGLCVLYTCEPVREHALLQYGDERHWGYVEEEALRYFLENIGVLGQPVRSVIIRPHPSEPAGKYDWVQGEFDLPLVKGGDAPLLEEIANCDVVVGCESMALVIGLLAGKRVLSSIPPAGRKCTLPHREIESLQALLAEKASTTTVSEGQHTS